MFLEGRERKVVLLSRILNLFPLTHVASKEDAGPPKVCLMVRVLFSSFALTVMVELA